MTKDSREKFNIKSSALYEALVPNIFSSNSKGKDAAERLKVSEHWLSELERGNIKMVSPELALRLYDLGITPKMYVVWGADRVEEQLREMREDVTPVPSVSSAPKQSQSKLKYVCYKIPLQLQKEPTPDKVLSCLQEEIEQYFGDPKDYVDPEDAERKLKSVLSAFRAGKDEHFESDEVIIEVKRENGNVTYSFVRFEEDGTEPIWFSQYIFGPKRSLDVIFGTYIPIPENFGTPVQVLKNLIWRFGAKDKGGATLSDLVERYNENEYKKFNEASMQSSPSCYLIFPFVSDNLQFSRMNIFADRLVGIAHVTAPENPFVNSEIASHSDIKAVDFPIDNEVMVIGDGVKKIYHLGDNNIVCRKICTDILDQHYKTPANENLERLPKLNLYSPEKFEALQGELAELQMVSDEQDKTITSLKKSLEETKAELAAFVEENGRLDTQNKELMAEVESTKSALASKKAALKMAENRDGNSNRVSFFTPERELYEGEICDVILKVIQKELDTMKDQKVMKSRKYHVLSSIVTNNVRTGEDERLTDEFKAILSSGDGLLDSSVIKKLEALGCTVDRSGVHPKLSFNGDPRYAYYAPSTSGDNRSGKNTAITFARLLFGY